MKKVKKAFTLLELIIVITVLGIIALMSFNTLMNLYQNYFQSKTVNDIETQSEIALEQISSLLSHRIKQSVIARKQNGDYLALNDSGVNLSNDFEILEFIPAAYELFNGVGEYKGTDASGNDIVEEGLYSGYVDLANSSVANGLKSPGSKFNDAFKNSVKDLTCKKDNDDNDNITSNDRCIDANNENSGLVAIFSGILYKVSSSFGYQDAFHESDLDIAKVGIKSIDTLKISSDFATHKKISEQYKLAYTAIAIAPGNQSTQDEKDGVFDLKIYYNYRPWLNESFKNFGGSPPKDITAESATLAKRVTRFVFTEKNGVIALKLCVKAEKSEITICKSKAVY
ncbi:hypothetical protein UNSW1_503 [Campylobacter concisus UNSW1]|uniref:type II secretion system protein n=1 Tax=Campylobacter concisus TaxID=199 RepID=UPI000398DA85|nr:type II secretion system protein [Campylobacter concisus]ERJ22211.1 hypothetical protein UNSW1_503 [Campylobacter concisus UNSW1]